MYTADCKALAYMSKSFIREVVDLFTYFFFNEISDYLLSSCVVREREIDLFFEELFALFERCVIGLVCACNHCNPIIFRPEFIFLKISKNLLHFWAKNCSPVFLLLLYSTKNSLKVINHDDCRLILFSTNNDRP